MKKGYYEVLRPVFQRADINGKENYQVSWEVVGTADSMEEAKSYVKAPVLQVREQV